MNRPRLNRFLAGAAFLIGATAASSAPLIFLPRPASACGCFAPPNVAVPVIQAGERILFTKKNDEVVAHIQIQYSGQPGNFGWLLPLPSIPQNKLGLPGIDIGVDELFSQLTTATQPQYRLNRVYETCGSNVGIAPELSADMAGRSGVGSPGAPSASGMMSGPLVIQDTIGPYNFAILKADNKDEMLSWLNANSYLVPANTDSAVEPYIRPGAYFLALKLHAGLSAGDLQPVIIRYKSDLPMIPINLTSVGAVPNMGIQVWMLGEGRAIPRNYYHTVVNDAQINWFLAGQNYNDVIIKAVGEADGKHAFVTEYAGTSAIMRNTLDRAGRFANLPSLTTVTDPISYVQQALSMFILNGQFTAIVQRYIPFPAALAAQGVTLAQYYQQIGFYLGPDRMQNQAKYMDIEAALQAFDPAKLTSELRTKIADPTVEAGALFSAFPYLTRLYTTLSPADMNRDPVFSYNPGLSDYPNIHQATLTYHCAGFFASGRYSDATLDTPSGFRLSFSVDDANSNVFAPVDAPYSHQIQRLRETGGPELVADNTDQIRSALGQSGCMQSGPASQQRGATAGLALFLGAIALTAARRLRKNA